MTFKSDEKVREPRAEFVGAGTSRWHLFMHKYSAMPALHLAGFCELHSSVPKLFTHSLM